MLKRLEYLSQVREMAPPLSDRAPIWVRHGTVTSGPTNPSPEQHPCCEFGIGLGGKGVEFVGSECAERVPGDVLLLGPHQPHAFEPTQYPIKFVTTFFPTSLLLELGPSDQGLRLLRRFVTAQSIGQRLVRPPRSLRSALVRGFETIAAEYDGQAWGWQIRIRALVAEMLVELVRLESDVLEHVNAPPHADDWTYLSRAIGHLRTHFHDELYGRDLAAAVGLSETHLNRLFRRSLGTSWVHYLQSYRIQVASGLISSGECNVTEAAFRVGFTSLSHFNSVFQRFTGCSPKNFHRGV